MKATKLTSRAPENSICIGTGLIALDVIISSISNIPPQFLAGGSCGNVLAILSYLGWSAFPIARLSNNVAAELLIEDLKKWNVNNDLLTITSTGSTPIIIHRILKDQQGIPKHRFEFRNPEDGKYLPSYKPCLAKSVPGIFKVQSKANVFYFDRINRGAIDLAKLYKENGATIFFEPSNIKDEKGFRECLKLADVIKFSNERIDNYEELYPCCQVALEIQTLGIKGLKFRRSGQTLWTLVLGYVIDDVVDSAGAGDWCTAGIINSLFKFNHPNINELTEDDLYFAYRFGQAMSALNCTFEGARGLMYNLPFEELSTSVEHILRSDSQKIQKRSRSNDLYSKSINSIKISSLF